MHQEDDVRQRHQRDFFQERRAQRIDGLADEGRAVVEGHDTDTLRKPWGNLCDARLHRVDHGLRVRAAACHNDAADRFGASLDQRRHAEGVADVHGGHLRDVNRRAVGGADGYLLDVGHRFDEPDAAHDGPGAIGFEHIAADILITATDGLDDVTNPKVDRTQAVRIDIDLVLLDVATDRRDLSHPWHRVELIPNEPVLDRAQLA